MGIISKYKVKGDKTLSVKPAKIYSKHIKNVYKQNVKNTKPKFIKKLIQTKIIDFEAHYTSETFENSVLTRVLKTEEQKDLMLKALFRYNFLHQELKINKFKGIHKGERCFIVGNGPSINKTNLSLIYDEIVFCVNSFYKYFNIDKFKYLHYCISDCAGLVLNADVLSYDIPIFLGISAAEYYLRYSSKFEEFNVKPILIKRRKGFKKFSKDLRKGTFSGFTVVYDLCLQLVYYMGFSEVYLIGCDCSDADGEHFYKDESDSNYNKNSFKYIIKPSYEKSKKEFEKDGRKVYNATVGGNLEVFERKSLESVVLGE